VRIFLFASVLIVLLLPKLSRAQSGQGDISDFVTKGWQVEFDTVIALTHFTGRALILRETDSSSDFSGERDGGGGGRGRRLLILAKESNGKFSLVARNDRILPSAELLTYYDFRTLWKDVITYKHDQLRVFIDLEPGWFDFVF